MKVTVQGLIAGREYDLIQNNCALGAKFLHFGMILGIGLRFSKTTANKLGVTSGGLHPQNSKWPPPKTRTSISQPVFGLS